MKIKWNPSRILDVTYDEYLRPIAVDAFATLLKINSELKEGDSVKIGDWEVTYGNISSAIIHFGQFYFPMIMAELEEIHNENKLLKKAIETLNGKLENNQ